MTTYAEFLNGLSALSVEGVARPFDHPPASLNASDLPAMWVQLPRGDDRPIAFQRGAYWATLRADLVVAVAAVAQGTQEENFAATVAMMDAVSAALRDADLSAGPQRWTIRQDVVEVAGVAYWAVVAEVEGGG